MALEHAHFGSGLRQATAAITDLGRQGRWAQSLALLEQLCAEGPKPDKVAFGAALAACERGSQWSKALALLQEFQPRALEPDSKCFGAAVGACVRSLRWEWSLVVFRDMCIAGVAADIIMYSKLISADQLGGLWVGALQRLAQMSLLSGLRADVVIYNSLLSTCTRCGQWPRALALWSVIRTAGEASFNIVTSNALIDALASSHGADRGAVIWHGAVDLLRKALEARLTPTLVTCSQVAAVCQAAGHGQQVQMVLAAMGSWRCAPDRDMDRALIIACSRSGDWSSALSWLQTSFCRTGEVPDQRSF
ncbi:unnamed protein product, partial [Polarella glacialis]